MGQYQRRFEDHCFNCGDNIGGDVIAASEEEEVYCSIACMSESCELDNVVCDVCGRDWHCEVCSVCEFEAVETKPRCK